MIFSPMSLIETIKSGKLIEGLSERELSTPEGVGFDLCVASLAEIQEGSGSLKVKTRRTPDSIVVDPKERVNQTCSFRPLYIMV